MSTSTEKDLIRFIKKHAKEKVEFENMETGEMSSMSRVEALSLVMWKLAHGHAVYDTVEDKDGVEKRRIVNYYPPDKTMIKELGDRLIGKPKASPVKEKEDHTARGVPLDKKMSEISEKFRQVKKGVGDEKSGARTTAKTDAGESLSRQLGKLGVPCNQLQGPERSG